MILGRNGRLSSFRYAYGYSINISVVRKGSLILDRRTPGKERDVPRLLQGIKRILPVDWRPSNCR